MTEEQRFYIKQIEAELDRGRSTIRAWERNGWLPDGCEFHRDEKGWRYWTSEQVQKVRSWMETRNSGRVAGGLERHH